MADQEIWDKLGQEHHDIRGEDLKYYLQKVKSLNIPWDSSYDPECGGGYSTIYVGTIPPQELEIERQDEI